MIHVHVVFAIGAASKLQQIEDGSTLVMGLNVHDQVWWRETDLYVELCL